MGFNHLHWLEIAEYISVTATAIGIVIALLSGELRYTLTPLSLALVLNLINRLRIEQRSRGRSGRAMKQLHRKLSEEIKALEKKLNENAGARQYRASASPPPPTAEMEKDAIASAFQEELASLDRSIRGVIKYLNNYSLPERVQHLEESYSQLKAEITGIYRQITGNIGDLTLAETDLPPTGRQTSLPSVPQISWKCLQTLTGHSESVTALAISSDGRYLASGSWDRTLKLWSLANGNLIDTAFAHSQGILAVSFTGSGDRKTKSNNYYLATGSFDQNIKLWLLKPDERDELIISLNHTTTGHTGSIHALAIAPEQKILVSGSYDRTVKQWDLYSGKLLRSSYDQLGAIYAIALDRQGEFIASGGGDGSITLWQLGSGEMLGFLSGNVSSVESLAISPDGQILAAGCVDGSIKLWYLEPGIFDSGREQSPSLILPAHSGQVKSLVFSRDGQTLFSSGADGRIKVWHPDSGQQLAVLKISDDNRVFSLALSPDGELLAAGGADGTIKIWRRDS